jgi:hypothetical protein
VNRYTFDQEKSKGTPSQIVGDMRAWFESQAVDGVLIQPS